MSDDIGRESARLTASSEFEWTEHISTSNQARSGPHSAFFRLFYRFCGNHARRSCRPCLYVVGCWRYISMDSAVRVVNARGT